MGRSGDVARVALLDVAERLFALHGVGGVSLREISSAAGHRNHSSVQYHFGDRAGLVAAVFERRMQVINTRRMVLLEELDANGRGLDLGGLVEASYIPAVELVCETRAWYGRFLIRTQWDPFAKDITRALPEASSVRQITRRLHRALGDELPSPCVVIASTS